ncbi:MAG: hypothetical protein ACO1PI_07165 [Bacteroidota bacterium]
METIYGYEITKKLQNLSNRLASFSIEQNKHHIDPLVKLEGLQRNLPSLLSAIINELELPMPSEKELLEVISEYNHQNNTQITIEEYKSLTWVREILGEVKIPSVISHYLWKIGYDKSEGKDVTIPSEIYHQIICLKEFYDTNVKEKYLTISKEKLKGIIETHAPSNITIEYLISEKIVKHSLDNELYVWDSSNEYNKNFCNEIFCILWDSISKDTVSTDEFKLFIQRVKLGVWYWPENLEKLLAPKKLQYLTELSFRLLMEETDLLNSDKEFVKAWLDAPHYAHYINLENEIPILSFSGVSTIKLIDNIEVILRRYRHIYEFPDTRRVYSLLLHFILEYEKDLYLSKTVLKSLNRPYLVWSLFDDIFKMYPKKIPLLLTDIALAPLAFDLLQEISIKESFFKGIERHEMFSEGLDIQLQIWLDSFDILLSMASSQQGSPEFGESIYKILYNLSKQVFFYTQQGEYQEIKHQKYSSLYKNVFQTLSLRRSPNCINSLTNTHSRIIFPLILPLLNSYCFREREITFREYLTLDLYYIDLGIELLRLANTVFLQNEVLYESKNSFSAKVSETVIVISNHIKQFFNLTELTVITEYSSDSNIKKAKRERGYGFEIVDWAYLFLLFDKYNQIHSINEEFKNSIEFDKSSAKDKHSDQNKEQIEKIIAYIKILLLTYLGLNKNRNTYELEGYTVSETINTLESYLIHYSTFYFKDALEKGQVDIFSEPDYSFERDFNYQSILSLLFRCVNIMNVGTGKSFISKLFAENDDLHRLLTALNLVEAKSLKNILMTKIESANVDSFIESKYTVTDLEETMIEAINSDNQWQFAEPLLKKVENHYITRNYLDYDKEVLLYQVKLLLAFKKKEIDSINTITVPEIKHGLSRFNENEERRKKYFIALHLLYNEKNYSTAVTLLEQLSAQDTLNLPYAFHLFRARVYVNHTGVSLRKAQEEWHSRLADIQKTTTIEYSQFEQGIESINVLIYSKTKDFTKFDLSIDRLQNRYLFDPEIVEIIYQTYKSRDLHIQATKYIERAFSFCKENEVAEIESIKELYENRDDEKLEADLKNAFSRWNSILPQKLVTVLPETANGKRNLEEFILQEIITAFSLMLDKRDSVTQIKDENRLTMFLQAILKAKLSVWNWGIYGQDLIGASETGKRAGEADLIIDKSGLKIALIEALNYSGSNPKNISSHLVKCYGYDRTLKNYFVLIYNRKKSSKFHVNWKKYQANVIQANFPPEISITNTDFTDLSSKFMNINGMYIAKTNHKSNVTYYHLFVDVGENS